MQVANIYPIDLLGGAGPTQHDPVLSSSCTTEVNIPHMGLSENSVPLHPMVLLIIIPTKWL